MPDGESAHGLPTYCVFPKSISRRLDAIWPELRRIAPDIAEQIEIDGHYAGYLQRQEARYPRLPPRRVARPAARSRLRRGRRAVRRSPAEAERRAAGDLGRGGQHFGHHPRGAGGLAAPCPPRRAGRRPLPRHIRVRPVNDRPVRTALTREGFHRLANVSRETMARLEAYVELLEAWKAINLSASTTIGDPWRRHILDSAQLLGHLPERPAPCRSRQRRRVSRPGSGHSGRPGGAPGRNRPAQSRVLARGGAGYGNAGANPCRAGSSDIGPRRRDVVTARALHPCPSCSDYAARFTLEPEHLPASSRVEGRKTN